MIADRCFNKEQLYRFICDVNDLFIPSMSEFLAQKGMDLKAYADKLADKGTIVYEESFEGACIGMIAGYMHDMPDHYSHIALVAVKNQRKGLFKKMFAEYEKYAVTRGIEGIWLEVLSDNDVALAAYRKVGFQCVKKTNRGGDHRY